MRSSMSVWFLNYLLSTALLERPLAMIHKLSLALDIIDIQYKEKNIFTLILSTAFETRIHNFIWYFTKYHEKKKTCIEMLHKHSKRHSTSWQTLSSACKSGEFLFAQEINTWLLVKTTEKKLLTSFRNFFFSSFHPRPQCQETHM